MPKITMRMHIIICAVAFLGCYLPQCSANSDVDTMKLPDAIGKKLGSIKVPSALFKGSAAVFLVEFDKALRQQSGTRLRINFGADVSKSIAEFLSEPIRDTLGIADDESDDNPFATRGGRIKSLNALEIIRTLGVRLSPSKVTYENGVISITIRNE